MEAVVVMVPPAPDRCRTWRTGSRAQDYRAAQRL
jgi:hypothetical protein